MRSQRGFMGSDIISKLHGPHVIVPITVMRIDLHCHVVGKGSDIGKADREVYFNVGDNSHWLTGLLYHLVEMGLKDLQADLDRDGTITTGEYLALLYRLLADSTEIDGVVLLALDAVYSPETGELDVGKTDLWVSNRFVWEQVKALNERLLREGKQGKQFFFGASVSPNRKDWERELDFVISRTEAVLIKLIPSTQHVDISSDRHLDYFKTLADQRMPLLCHVGPEYSFPEGIRMAHLDNFRSLKNPLDCGVTVIAAHCATPVFPVVDRNETADFLRFMEQANAGGEVRLRADTSALSLATRVGLVSQIVENFPFEWLVHGSDFPIPVDAWPHLPWVAGGVTGEEYRAIAATGNPLDRDVRIKRAYGFPDSVLRKAEEILRLPRPSAGTE
jgi:predicted TIM-barrel fold metal-dependent hydrolase